MGLLKKFSFKDPDAQEWAAPAGAVIDGASIPRALWTIVGSPYTGDYRISIDRSRCRLCRSRR